MVRCASGVTRIRQRAVGAPPASGAGGEMHARGADVMREDLAELVIRHLAEEPDPGAERRRHRAGVAGRTARAFDTRPHLAVERIRFIRADQPHAALRQAARIEEFLIGAGEHIDDGVADADDVEGRLAHGLVDLSRVPSGRPPGSHARRGLGPGTTGARLAFGPAGRNHRRNTKVPAAC